MFNLEYETLMTILVYTKFGITSLVTFVFVYYIYTLYKRQYTGEKDYEKYSNLVLDDAYDSIPLEKRTKTKEGGK